jgi:hypothetical protein
MLLPYVAVGGVGLLLAFGMLIYMASDRIKALTRLIAVMVIIVFVEAALLAILGTPLKGEVIYKLLGLP